MRFGKVLTYRDIDEARKLIGKEVIYSDNFKEIGTQADALASFWSRPVTLTEVGDAPSAFFPFALENNSSSQFIREIIKDEQEINKAIGKIAENYGAKEQKEQSLQRCEECCAELIQTVEKLTRGETPGRILSLIEEIADARIMMSQLMCLYGIPESEITNQIEGKVEEKD